MFKKINQNIPSNSLSYMLICGGVIVLSCILLIIPFYRYNAGIAQETASLQHQIAEQKELAETYQLLKIAANKKQTYALPNPAGTKLSRQNVEKFPEIFRAEAEKSGLATASLFMDTKTMTGESKSLLYNATVKGEFANFRKLLIGLGAVPYIDQIEEISIKQDRDNMEFKLKIWIALAG
jgi:Tfp pilus assembly protein PilO